MTSVRPKTSNSSSGGGGSSARRTARRSKSPDMPAGETGSPGLRTLIQQRILKDVFDASSGMWCLYCSAVQCVLLMMIVDEFSVLIALSKWYPDYQIQKPFLSSDRGFSSDSFDVSSSLQRSTLAGKSLLSTTPQCALFQLRLVCTTLWNERSLSWRV